LGVVWGFCSQLVLKFEPIIYLSFFENKTFESGLDRQR
jgi:hypothetical protein